MVAELIGLSGFARSGKDEAAKILVDEYGFTKVAFADKLREALYALNPLVGIEGEPWEGGLDFITLKMVIDRHGWNGYKETEHGPEIRRLLQRLGTEAGREVLGPNIWLDAALVDVSESDRVCVSDMRFRNEKQAIESRGGKTLRINRVGIGPANNHPSEIELANESFDFTIENDGSLDEFRAKVDRFAHELNL